MTVICGITDSESVWLAADSCGSANDRELVIKQPKVFVRTIVSGQQIVVGYSGSFRMGQLLEYVLDVPPLLNGFDEFEWAVRDLVPAIAKMADDSGLARIENDLLEQSFLFGINGRLFNLQQDFAVLEHELEYHCIGVGQEYARGSLFTTDGSEMSPEDRLECAVSASAMFCAGVMLPCHVVSTEDPTEGIQFAAEEGD